jgi:hypothetical protein
MLIKRRRKRMGMLNPVKGALPVVVLVVIAVVVAILLCRRKVEISREKCRIALQTEEQVFYGRSVVFQRC